MKNFVHLDWDFGSPKNGTGPPLSQARLVPSRLLSISGQVGPAATKGAGGFLGGIKVTFRPYPPPRPGIPRPPRFLSLRRPQVFLAFGRLPLDIGAGFFPVALFLGLLPLHERDHLFRDLFPSSAVFIPGRGVQSVLSCGFF